MPMWKLTVRRRGPNKMLGRDSPSVVLCAQFSDDTYREATCRRTWLQGKEECIGEERSTYTIGAQLFLINGEICVKCSFVFTAATHTSKATGLLVRNTHCK